MLSYLLGGKLLEFFSHTGSQTMPTHNHEMSCKNNSFKETDPKSKKVEANIVQHFQFKEKTSNESFFNKSGAKIFSCSRTRNTDNFSQRGSHLETLEQISLNQITRQVHFEPFDSY